MENKEQAKALNSLVENNGNADVFSIWKVSDKKPLNTKVIELIASANKEIPVHRRLLQSDVFSVVSRALGQSLTASVNPEYRELEVLRTVNDFIKVAVFNNTPKYCQNYFDLLPIGHPLSTRDPLYLTKEEVKEHKAIWLSSDPRIAEEYRPLVASAYKAPKGSIEHKYLVARLESLPQAEITRETLLELIGY
jgi:hypothetical protein